jgi:hypothetical protein
MTTNRSYTAFQANPTAETAGSPRRYQLPYGACYAYSPKGESEVSQRSRLLCGRVKNGSPQWLKSYVATACQERRLRNLFNERTLLVPIPQYPTNTRASLWVARRLAFTLQEAGLGEEVWTGLRRMKAVEKSAVAWMWQRPTVKEHYQSFTVLPSSKQPSDIVLVDDVITKGRTLVAAAMRVHEAFPTAVIRAFVLVRTMGFVRDVERLYDPCEGVIRWNGRDAYRDP